MKKKILIVEDDTLTAFWIKTVLLELGYDAYDPVDSGEIAVETAIAVKPDFIFMDIWLSGSMNGIEAAAEILTRIETSIIFISGYSESELLSRCGQIKYSAFLQKPLVVYDIENVLKMEKQHPDE